MKKVIAIILSLCVAACLFAACAKTPSTDETTLPDETAAPDDTAAEGSALEAVKAAGKLVIATSPDFPPFEELTPDMQVEGIEIDIMNIIAEKLGVELAIEQISFESVIPGVQADKYDAGVSGITITEERAENVLFTVPYCVEAQAIVVVDGSEIASKDDLADKAVSVQTGTTADIFCTENGYNVSQYEANSDAELALTSGKVDAWVIDNATAKKMVEEYNAQSETKLVILDEKMTEEPYAFAFNLADGDLVDAVNEILNEMLADGTIENFFAEWQQDYTAPSASAEA